MLLELIGLIILAAVALEVVFLFILAFLDVTAWFYDHSYIYQRDADNIAVTLQKKLAAGEYETVQGIFNKRENRMASGRKVRSSGYDDKLAEKHRNNELVVWE
jgi:hypothetical protein